MTEISRESYRPLASAEEYDATNRAETGEAARTKSAAATTSSSSSSKASAWDSSIERYDVSAATLFGGLTAAIETASQTSVQRTADGYAGPYQVGGNSWFAPAASTLPKLTGDASKAKDLAGLVGADLAARVQSGQACPEDIRCATQALLQKCALPAEPAGDPAGQIRALQRKYGIGVDGAGYARNAAASANGRASLPLGSDLAMRHLDSNPHFERVKPGDVKPGDIITLDPRPGQKMGQNVVVYRNDRLGDAQMKGLSDKCPELTMFFLSSKGPFHIMAVDSSWGADGKDPGGARREVWLYDESTKQWAHQERNADGRESYKISPNGPTDANTFHGAYRVK